MVLQYYLYLGVFTDLQKYSLVQSKHPGFYDLAGTVVAFVNQHRGAS